MIDCNKLLSFFNDQSIRYNFFEHPPLKTVEESKRMRGKINGAHTKNLFLKNKKNAFYLFSCLESTFVDLKQLRKKLELGSLSFAKEQYLRDMLNVKVGAVTPFGLLNDKENTIDYYLDVKIIDHEYVNFHPLINTATVNIGTKDFLSFMKNNKKLVKIINFDTYSLDYE